LITILAPLFEWVQGADHPNPDTLRSRNNRAMSYLAAGRPAKAIPLYRWTLADCERMLGAYHPYTLRSRINLATGYRAAGRTAEAIPLLSGRSRTASGYWALTTRTRERRGRAWLP
jgi:hypothetical protein